MSRAARSETAIITGLRAGEAATLLAALTSGYQRAQEAAQSAYSEGERQARKRLARDLYRLASQEHSAGQQARIYAPRLPSCRSLSRRIQTFPQVQRCELEAGE